MPTGQPVDNVIATKGLQDRNINILAGKTVQNKGKLILTEIFPSVQNMIFFNIDFLSFLVFEPKVRRLS